MVTLTIEKGEASPPSVPPMGRGVAAVRELGLRIIAAGLQILATVAVVLALAPAVAGIYFRGAVICYGLAALLRGKYDLFVAQHFVEPLAHGSADRTVSEGIPRGDEGVAGRHGAGKGGSGETNGHGEEGRRAGGRGRGK